MLNEQISQFYLGKFTEGAQNGSNIEVDKTQFTTVTGDLSITADDISSNKFAISNDCTAFRIGDKIIHDMKKDTYPAGVTKFDDPVFTPDFNIAVVNSGIYKYTAGVDSSTPGNYEVAITQIFDTLKKVFIDGNNIIVFIGNKL